MVVSKMNKLILNEPTLNVEKTKFMIFYLNININGIQIAETNRTNFLGIVFKSRLTQINHLSTRRKMSKVDHVIRRFHYIHTGGMFKIIILKLFIGVSYIQSK